ncbi:MAG: MFS transporter [Acidiferrobacterales bacterium]
MARRPLDRFHIQLCGFYFFYFATLGGLIPYLGLYLHSVGYRPDAIGSIMALLVASRIVAPLVWGWLADHRERRMVFVRLASFFALVAFSGMYLAKGFWAIAAVVFVFGFFWNASLPLLEATTMSHTGSDPGAYGRVRLWGSIGFITCVLSLGVVIDRYGPWTMLPALSLLMAGNWLLALNLPEAELRGRLHHPGPLREALLRREVFAFLLACFLMQMSHGPYYTFYSLYLAGHGYSKSVIGALWAFAVLCEIGVFLSMRRLLARIALRPVLLASFALAAVRWLLIGYFPAHLAVLVFAQALHAATFGAFHAAAMQMIDRFFTGRHQHRGQAIYGSASIGLGGAVGSFWAGRAWTALGSTATFTLAALAASLAFLVALLLLRPAEPQ